jgi:TrpR-related protein YerC/YecD
MTDEAEDWRTPQAIALLEAILALPDRASAERFFRDLCTRRELHDLAQRWQVVRLLDAGLHYGEISRQTGASTATITRIAQWLHHGTGGYREALERSAVSPEAQAARPVDPLPDAPRRNDP